MVGPLGLCGWVLLGTVASVAIWELGGFAMDVHGPARPTADREPPRPVLSTPESGCSQARIDRATGQTVVGECPVRGAATLAVWVQGAGSKR